ncbi:SUN domain-containing protein 2 isoform X2 [Amblyraja radiata]|uniref:SUN domain-containing protein 2 isoform X2 n=1 Tax=Amblyraja radiata TaxID=386614 RepID=UPI001402FCEE|nr:SUN domain-containing protein 2 isoform X2 [Amblyraja radiata]
MSRRSLRLVTTGYYQDDDDASSSSGGSSINGAPSYKESPVRLHKKRSNSKRPGPAPGVKRSASNSSVNSLSSNVSNASKRSLHLGGSSSSGWQEPVVTGPSSFEDRYEEKFNRANGRMGIMTEPSTSSDIHLSSTSGYSSEDERQGLAYSESFSPLAKLWGWISLLSPGKALPLVYWWLGTAWYQLTTAISLIDVFTLSRFVPHVKKWMLLVLLALLGVGLLMLSRSIWSRAEKPGVLESTQVSPQAGLQVRVHRMEKELELLTADFRAWRDLGGEPSETIRLPPPLTPAHIEQLGKVTLQRLEELQNMLPFESLERVQADIAAIQQMHEERTEPALRAVDYNNKMLLQKVKEMESAVERLTDEQKQLLTALALLEEQLSQTRLELQAAHAAQKDMDSSMQALESRVKSMTDKETALLPLVHKLLFGSSEDSTGEPLTAQLVKRKELEALLAGLEKKILSDASLYPGLTMEAHTAAVRAGIIKEVKSIVEQALKLYSADRVGLVDYALESAGGSVIHTRCSETLETKTALLSLFGFPLWYQSHSPRAVIQPEVHPGNCWAFKGSQGFVVIELAVQIRPTTFTLEHIPRSISLHESIRSAPQDFSVYGLDDENQAEGVLLGQYTYNVEGDSIQMFEVQNKDAAAYKVIELRVNSNWGHPEYTCIYRFRVHGEPAM